MCTLTFVPKNERDFILTSNRDEAPDRETAAPEFYEKEGRRLLYPKDMRAGGTWIGLSDRGRLICLLNGGFTAHKRKASYKMSRGVVVKQLLVTEDLKESIHAFDFEGIEPFTIVSVMWHDRPQLLELVWDGIQSHVTERPWETAIWSSSLLYDRSMKEARVKWFSEFLQQQPPTASSLLRFHKEAGKEHQGYALIMDRGFVKTKSITQITHSEALSMRYETIPDGEVKTIIF